MAPVVGNSLWGLQRPASVMEGETAGRELPVSPQVEPQQGHLCGFRAQRREEVCVRPISGTLGVCLRGASGEEQAHLIFQTVLIID